MGGVAQAVVEFDEAVQAPWRPPLAGGSGQRAGAARGAGPAVPQRRPGGVAARRADVGRTPPDAGGRRATRCAGPFRPARRPLAVRPSRPGRRRPARPGGPADASCATARRGARSGRRVSRSAPGWGRRSPGATRAASAWRGRAVSSCTRATRCGRSLPPSPARGRRPGGHRRHPRAERAARRRRGARAGPRPPVTARAATPAGGSGDRATPLQPGAVTSSTISTGAFTPVAGRAHTVVACQVPWTAEPLCSPVPPRRSRSTRRGRGGRASCSAGGTTPRGPARCGCGWSSAASRRRRGSTSPPSACPSTQAARPPQPGRIDSRVKQELPPAQAISALRGRPLGADATTTAALPMIRDEVVSVPSVGAVAGRWWRPPSRVPRPGGRRRAPEDAAVQDGHRGRGRGPARRHRAPRDEGRHRAADTEVFAAVADEVHRLARRPSSRPRRGSRAARPGPTPARDGDPAGAHRPARGVLRAPRGLRRPHRRRARPADPPHATGRPLARLAPPPGGRLPLRGLTSRSSVAGPGVRASPSPVVRRPAGGRITTCRDVAVGPRTASAAAVECRSPAPPSGSRGRSVASPVHPPAPLRGRVV